MSAALDLYAKLSETTDEKERARLIADAFDALETRFPQITDLATQGHVRESELRLQKEIKEVEARLQREIEQVRANLTLQIEQLRGEVKTEIERSRNTLLAWLIPLMFAQVGAMAALVKLL